MKRTGIRLLFLFLLMTYCDDALAQRREGSQVAGLYPGVKLLETELYELYESDCLDTPYPNRAAVNLVFKVDANYVITDDATYRRRFEEEILPIIKKRCPLVNDITINNYIKGVRIRYWDYKEFGYSDAAPSSIQETPLTVMWVSINKQGEIHLVDQYRTRSLAELRRRRQQREAEEAAKSRDPEAERIAKIEYTSDGKLRLTGIEHKKLFQQIYDADFTHMLAEDVSDSYLPYLMFSGHISVYGDMCRSSLSASAVGVDIYAERYLRTEYSAFTRTEYYERYLAKTVYMEPQYVTAYRLSVPTSLAKIYESWKRRPGDIGVPAYFIMASTRALPLLLDSRQLISSNGCGSPSTIRFMDNLHKYVTGNWSTVTADGYKYIEKENPNMIRRYYAKVPATFSPKFPVPSKEEQVTYYLNESGSESGYGYENESPGLKKITVARFGFGWDKQVEDLSKLTSVPQYVLDAKEARKYYVATCEYLVGGGAVSIHYWNANGPLPPASVQEFVKGIIREPRTECPTTYPGR